MGVGDGVSESSAVGEGVGVEEITGAVEGATISYWGSLPQRNSAAAAIDAAMADVRAGRTGDIPAHIKDAHYGGAQKLGRGLTYQYPHAFPNHWVRQQYLPDEIKDAHYYDYGPNKTEQAARAYWERVKGGK